LKHENVKAGSNFNPQENVHLGLPSREYMKRPEKEWPQTSMGDNVTIRSGTIIYCDVSIGDDFQSGHNVIIREKTRIKDRVLVGTNTIIEGRTVIGNDVSIQSSVYIPLDTIIEDRVFIGPCAVLTNDKYPIRKKRPLKGPTIRKGASIGANSTILPGIVIGEGAMVAAGAVVTKDVPGWKMAIGVPARIVDLPDDLKTMNLIGEGGGRED
jgi:acetyltransferase-like isoleucine patch superfamily enzyme